MYLIDEQIQLMKKRMKKERAILLLHQEGAIF